MPLNKSIVLFFFKISTVFPILPFILSLFFSLSQPSLLFLPFIIFSQYSIPYFYPLTFPLSPISVPSLVFMYLFFFVFLFVSLFRFYAFIRILQTAMQGTCYEMLIHIHTHTHSSQILLFSLLPWNDPFFPIPGGGFQNKGWGSVQKAAHEMIQNIQHLRGRSCQIKYTQEWIHLYQPFCFLVYMNKLMVALIV